MIITPQFQMRQKGSDNCNIPKVRSGTAGIQGPQAYWSYVYCLLLILDYYNNVRLTRNVIRQRRIITLLPKRIQRETGKFGTGRKSPKEAYLNKQSQLPAMAYRGQGLWFLSGRAQQESFGLELNL